MDRHEPDSRKRVPEGVLDVVCEGVSLVYGPVARNLDVNIDKQFGAAFPNATASDARDLRHPGGCVADL